MIASGFTNLLTGGLSTRVQWEASHRCGCVDVDGQAQRDCLVCVGLGVYYDAISTAFQLGITGVSARALEKIQQRFGPGIIGDAAMSIPANAPCYASIASGDRFLLPDNLDNLEWTLTPGSLVRLPLGATVVSAKAKNNAGTAMVAVSAPIPDSSGRVSSPFTMVLQLIAPRRYEVEADIAQSRAWIPGLPKRFTLKLIDKSVR